MIKSRRMKSMVHVARMGGMRIPTKFWLGNNIKGRDHLEDLSIEGRVNIRMYLGEIGREGVDCINLAQDRDQQQCLVNTVMNLGVP
jgi:hypothetical protein